MKRKRPKAVLRRGLRRGHRGIHGRLRGFHGGGRVLLIRVLAIIMRRRLLLRLGIVLLSF